MSRLFVSRYQTMTYASYLTGDDHYTYLQTGHPVTLEYPHYDGEATIGPVMISVFDFDGKLITRAKGAPESGDPEDDLLEAYGTLETAFVGELFERTEYVYAHGQKTEEHMWTAAGSGTAEKYITKFGYDEMGRLARVKDAAGTITRTYYTLQGRVAERQVGLNDYVEGDDLGEETGPNTMTTVEEFIYDEGASGGDGNLTTVKRYVDGSTSRDTVFVYDWRNRQEKVNGEDPYFERRDYDNMNRVTARYRYDTSDTGTLLSKFETKYDSRGRKYQTLIHYVSSGTIYNALTTDFWYDGRGKLIKSREPSGLFRKIEYDAAGRELRTFVSYDTDETAYADAGGITGDTVVEQRDYERDRVGNVLLETRWERLATGDTPGSLTTSSAVAYYTASWYDTVYRVVAVANYGTEEPELPSDPDELDRDELLVTSYSYNAAGHVEDIQGPSFVAAEPLAMPPTPAMHFTRREYDNLGRLTATTDNYVNGTAGPGAEDRRQVLTYDALSRVTHRKTWMSSSESQETEYVYGVTQDPGQGDPVEASLIDSKGLLKLIKYPDPDAGEGQGLPSEDEEDQEAFAYNAQGEIIWRKDQNGIVHEFTYDELGRRTADAVTTNPLPEGVIADVLRIGTTFDALDRVKKVTSYDAASGGDVENEVELVYNSIGQVLASKQEHNGAVTGSTLQVEYNYVAGGSPDPTNRLLYIKYPGTNRIVYFHYDQATGTDHEKMDWILMRPSAVSNYSSSSADRLADYTYEGLRRVRSRDNAEPSTDIGIDYSYDRFGRPEYITAASSSTINSLRYGYNRDSQVLWREESAGNVSGKDERYTYDDLDRLDTFERGDLNSGKTGLTGTAVRNQDWTLDLLGNWDTIASTQPASSTESRDHNRSNEITDVSIGGSGDEPSYDKNGNTTAIDEPAPAVLSYTYDAWNRLAKVAFGGTVLAVYRYDGFGRRIQNSQVSRSYYYSEGWQLLSERGGSDPAREYVWGLRYIDEIVERSEDANGDGDTRDAGEMGDASLFYIQDRNWNVHTVCDESGDPVERVLYDPYGIPKFYNGTWGSASDYSAYSNTVLFTGRLWNATSRTYCVRHREQSPYLGRFLQGDPIGTPIVFTPHVKNAKAAHETGKWGDPAAVGNAYGFVGSDTINRIDPLGLDDFQLIHEMGPFERSPWGEVNDPDCGWVVYARIWPWDDGICELVAGSPPPRGTSVCRCKVEEWDCDRICAEAATLAASDEAGGVYCCGDMMCPCAFPPEDASPQFTECIKLHEMQHMDCADCNADSCLHRADSIIDPTACPPLEECDAHTAQLFCLVVTGAPFMEILKVGEQMLEKCAAGK